MKDHISLVLAHKFIRNKSYLCGLDVELIWDTMAQEQRRYYLNPRKEG